MIEIVKFAVSRGVRYEKGRVVGVSGKPLAPRLAGKGYRVVGIPTPEGTFTNVYMHKLIYYLITLDDRAFNPMYEIHHEDGDRSNNAPNNLRLILAHDHESMPSKLNTHSAKITLQIARDIKAEYETMGVTQKALGHKYGLSQQHISAIVNGLKWGEIWEVDIERITR